VPSETGGTPLHVQGEMSMSSQLSQRVRALTFFASALVVASVLAGVAPALAVNLPDGRAYEEVTPVHMSGARAEPYFSSEDGEDVFYLATSPFAGPSGGADTSPYGAQRTPTGWQTSEIAPSASEYFVGTFAGEGPMDYSSLNFGRTLIQLQSPFDSCTGFCPPVPRRLYIQEAGSGGLAPTTEVDATPRTGLFAGETFSSQAYDGASQDLSHLFFQTMPNNPLAQTVEDYDLSGIWHYRYVGVEGPGSPDDSGSLISDCGSILGSGITQDGNPLTHTVSHAISADSSTVFFSVLALSGGQVLSGQCTKGPGVNELFARVNGSQTIPISEPSLANCPHLELAAGPPNFGRNPACANATFEGASSDGSKVFFTTSQQEVPGDTDTGNDLYEFDFSRPPGQNLIQISSGESTVGTPGSENANVVGVTHISDDGSHVYFVASGVLTSAPNSQGRSAQLGAHNLYVLDSGGTSFIGDLTDQDEVVWGPDSNNSGDDHPAWALPFGSATSDGHMLVFATHAQLITTGPEADSDTADDIYEYNSQTGSLVRISVGRNRSDDNGNNDSFDARIPSYSGTLYGARASGEARATTGNPYGVGRPASNDGSYVFFTTSEALQPEDVNGAPDVYEWHDGLVSLISDGRNPGTALGGNSGTANAFISSAANGRDVFFLTPDTLVPEGGASIANIYDARVGGGFPLANESPPCREDACQGSISATPSFPFATSATYAGGANLQAPAAEKSKAEPKRKATKRKPKQRKHKARKLKTKAKKSIQGSTRGRK
jgi:hypothetical protein